MTKVSIKYLNWDKGNKRELAEYFISSSLNFKNEEIESPEYNNENYRDVCDYTKDFPSDTNSKLEALHLCNEIYTDFNMAVSKQIKDRSISPGDMIIINDKYKFEVCAMGFREIC